MNMRSEVGARLATWQWAGAGAHELSLVAAAGLERDAGVGPVRAARGCAFARCSRLHLQIKPEVCFWCGTGPLSR